MPDKHPNDGMNLISLLKGGEPAARRTLFWHYPHYGNQGGAPGTAVRTGEWKLIHWFEDDRFELYDLADDLSEQHDLAADKPEKVAELNAIMNRMHAATGSINPTINRSYDPAKPSGREANPAKAKSKKKPR
jgi:arylsulfatase A-like enzyme